MQNTKDEVSEILRNFLLDLADEIETEKKLDVKPTAILLRIAAERLQCESSS